MYDPGDRYNSMYDVDDGESFGSNVATKRSHFDNRVNDYHIRGLVRLSLCCAASADGQ